MLSLFPENLILKYGKPGSPYPKDMDGSPTGFYRSWKPILMKEGFYHFLLGLESYLEFQKKISFLAEEPVGVSLALSCMVEVNVAGGILNHAIRSDSENQTLNQKKVNSEVLNSLWDGFRDAEPTKIFAVGVSEPGWETKLRKLSSKVENGKLSGTKSFITNGAEADSIFWVIKDDDSNPVYLVHRSKKSEKLGSNETTFENQSSEELFHTDFTPLVSHIKLTLCEYTISQKDLILENYGNLGMELRLKELLSLVSLLIGKTKKVSLENGLVAEEREKLIVWQETFLSQCYGNPNSEFLLSGFPYPTEGLLQAVTSYWNLANPKDLKSMDPDYQLFVWEDQFTKVLIQKKKRKLL
ncbi:acyl-CoA dehydrogenase [Leptospira sp. 2 VSF19]|uniref:Acyl-CoA dehydrogenase n=1 Tax=Leptospira soteropolitanensis TaxID=2950025 RepID=A0AAW5VML6_9LEPT|nr:acyl-CoA dehydrogenase [Leptospira soteropolitanensis]MCW7492052.1 acyl-CoA dehydrogenase [Leptospira soteropolitanensis]MCW7499634.1 acyl-CoA dehydrogenase [Leptospira soteropolitanensis]MCW7521885.1 acyl-CoA dehydrogenase [Leptospira soteropolitanensis]MCW7525739.1 acyl-CoA dehydrogenase [Leptospira soteropolitanensis]MCW7530147.1 acyl-CoA dehydrogenase [Leptospira soteropolitanensis]